MNKKKIKKYKNCVMTPIKKKNPFLKFMNVLKKEGNKHEKR